MYQVEDKPMETIHLYVVREEEPPRPKVFPIVLSVLFLVGIIATGTLFPYHKPLEQETIRIPALLLPPITFTASAPIIPTGIKTYPATTAHGILTITNGSVISQEMPSGLIFTGNDGVQVITDTAVLVPAGSAAGYGITHVSAHALIRGKAGNIPTLDIDRVEGSSVYIRNLKAFSGGQDAYSVKVVTPQDKQTAIDTARASLTTQEARRHEILAKPCSESSQVNNTAVRLFWTCQFNAYPELPHMTITAARLQGSNLFVDVVFVARPHRIWVK